MSSSYWLLLGDPRVATVPPWTGANLLRCDPYLVWADATTLAPPLAPPAEDKLNIAVLVELSKAEDYQAFFERMNPDAPDDFRFLPNGFEPHPPSCFITGLVDRDGLVTLVAEVARGLIQRFSLQNSRKDIADTIRIQGEDALPRANPAAPPSPMEAPRDAAEAPGTYLGIIDDGLPVLRIRDAVQLADKPAHFWDQGWQPPTRRQTQTNAPGPGQNDPYWEVAWDLFVLGVPPYFLFPLRGFLYGRRLRSLSSAIGAGSSNDRDEYFLSRYYTPAPRQTHGAGVLGLLAPWLSGERTPVEWPDHISGLAMVQLPTSTVLDTSGGSLATRVIDGLRYILWQEYRDRPDKKKSRPIVANVSYGVHAGPHDGTSMFERALGEMLTHHDHLRVVLPAGNAARAGIHARRELAAKGQQEDSATMALQVLPDNGHDTFVEIWVPKDADVEVSIRPPGSSQAYTIREGEARIHVDGNPQQVERVHFGAVYSKEVAQGTKGGMVLVAIGPTRVLRPNTVEQRGLNQRRRREVRGTPGLWELTVRNLASGAVTVDAWVERDDDPPDVAGASRQAYFPDSCVARVQPPNSTPESTLNGIATLKHDRLYVVGAMRTDGALSDYTAAGPARAPGAREAPDVVTQADWSRSVPGLRTIGFVRGAIARVNGTSAACAVYARDLAHRLANQPVPPLPTQDAPPEVTCVTDSQPEVENERLRGIDRRQFLPFHVLGPDP